MQVGDRYIDQKGTVIATVTKIHGDTATLEIRTAKRGLNPVITQLPVRLIEQNRTGWRRLVPTPGPIVGEQTQ